MFRLRRLCKTLQVIEEASHLRHRRPGSPAADAAVCKAPLKSLLRCIRTFSVLTPNWTVTRRSPRSHDLPPGHMIFLHSLVSSSHNQTKTKVSFQLCHPNHACMNISWLHKKVSVVSWPGPARPGNPRGHLTPSSRSSLRVKQFQRAFITF